MALGKAPPPVAGRVMHISHTVPLAPPLDGFSNLDPLRFVRAQFDIRSGILSGTRDVPIDQTWLPIVNSRFPLRVESGIHEEPRSWCELFQGRASHEVTVGIRRPGAILAKTDSGGRCCTFPLISIVPWAISLKNIHVLLFRKSKL